MTRVGVFVALLVTLFGGWLWGASGRWELDRALRVAELHNDLLEAHASLLGARVNFCDADFAEMSRQLETARELVGRAGARLTTPGLDHWLQGVDLAGFGAEINDAQRLAARISTGASPMPPR
jgi:hypothetical protein